MGGGRNGFGAGESLIGCSPVPDSDRPRCPALCQVIPWPMQPPPDRACCHATAAASRMPPCNHRSITHAATNTPSPPGWPWPRRP
jgi:hypothetical protein